jgi:hypothetical protein
MDEDFLCENPSATAFGASRTVWLKGRMCQQRLHLALLCSLFQTTYGCTRWEMGAAGFASGINSLYLAYPAFTGYNGTFYIDSRDWAYACSTTTGGLNNGMFDFFQLDGIAQWTETEDAQIGGNCRTSGIDAYRAGFFEDMPSDWHDLQVPSAIQVFQIGNPSSHSLILSSIFVHLKPFSCYCSTAKNCYQIDKITPFTDGLLCPSVLSSIHQ